jgi:hypothetical protein
MNKNIYDRMHSLETIFSNRRTKQKNNDDISLSLKYLFNGVLSIEEKSRLDEIKKRNGGLARFVVSLRQTDRGEPQ